MCRVRSSRCFTSTYASGEPPTYIGPSVDRVKAANLKPLFATAIEKLAGFGAWSIEHVRREKNKRADQLANMAMDARRDVVQTSANE